MFFNFSCNTVLRNFLGSVILTISKLFFNYLTKTITHMAKTSYFSLWMFIWPSLILQIWHICWLLFSSLCFSLTEQILQWKSAYSKFVLYTKRVFFNCGSFYCSAHSTIVVLECWMHSGLLCVLLQTWHHYPKSPLRSYYFIATFAVVFFSHDKQWYNNDSSTGVWTIDLLWAIILC